MRVKRKKIIMTGLICLLGVGLAVGMERQGNNLSESGNLPRAPAGEDPQEYSLIISGEGMEELPYSVSVEAAHLTDEQVKERFKEVEEEIADTFFRQGEGPDHASVCVYPQDTYASGLVLATWNFDDYDWITSQGVLQEDKLQEASDGHLIVAQVRLECQDQEEIYSFAFAAYPRERSPLEVWLVELEKCLRVEGEKSGTQEYHLPEMVSGRRILWREAKRNLVVKVVFFEMMVLMLLYLSDKEKQQQAIIERKRLIQLDYSEIVSKLSILMGSGMSLKMAWKRVASGYEKDRERNGRLRPAYEEMLVTLNQMEAGESELSAYRKFGERTGVHSFLRLSRLLIQNQQKGTRDLCEVLEKESEQAFEERKLLARKQGEEAGTKMLLPLLMMMFVVIAVVIVPAIMKF